MPLFFFFYSTFLTWHGRHACHGCMLAAGILGVAWLVAKRQNICLAASCCPCHEHFVPALPDNALPVVFCWLVAGVAVAALLTHTCHHCPLDRTGQDRDRTGTGTGRSHSWFVAVWRHDFAVPRGAWCLPYRNSCRCLYLTPVIGRFVSVLQRAARCWNGVARADGRRRSAHTGPEKVVPHYSGAFVAYFSYFELLRAGAALRQFSA